MLPVQSHIYGRYSPLGQNPVLNVIGEFLDVDY